MTDHIRWENKSRHTPKGFLQNAAPPRTQAEAKASMDYRKIEARNARLTTEGQDAQQKAGFCTYPRCKCIVQTSTTKPSPDCKLGLDYLPAGGA